MAAREEILKRKLKELEDAFLSPENLARLASDLSAELSSLMSAVGDCSTSDNSLPCFSSAETTENNLYLGLSLSEKTLAIIRILMTKMDLQNLTEKKED
jgi:hypothetical protein